MLSKMPRPSRTAATMLAKLSSARTMSDASRVTSVPVRPMAMPMCASRSAGRVVDAVAGHRHDRAPRLPVAHDAQLVLGRRARVHDRLGVLARAHDPHLARDGRAVVGWSPVIMTVRIPAARAAATASIASVRGGSAIPTSPTQPQVALLGARRRTATASTRSPRSAISVVARAASVEPAAGTAARPISSAP